MKRKTKERILKMGFKESKMYEFYFDNFNIDKHKKISRVESLTPSMLKKDTFDVTIGLIGYPKEEIKSILNFADKPQKTNCLPEKYIINENVCVCIWEDKTKTVSKKKENDVFDKELGFLFCCYQYYYKHLSRNKRSKILDWINYSSMKEFLFEIFKEKNNFTTNEAKRYLADLKVEKKKKVKTIKTELAKPKTVNEEVEKLEGKIQFLIEENKRLKEEKESHQKCDCTRKPKHAMEDLIGKI